MQGAEGCRSLVRRFVVHRPGQPVSSGWLAGSVDDGQCQVGEPQVVSPGVVAHQGERLVHRDARASGPALPWPARW